MITLYKAAYQTTPRARCVVGNSGDTMPIDAENGATYREIDTGKIYRFDAENKIWYEGGESK